LAPAVRKQYIEAERQLCAGDLSILKIKEMRNTLEAYSYEMRSNIDQYGSLEKYIEPNLKQKFMEEINQTVDWLYSPQGEQATQQELQVRITHFKQLGEPIKQR